MRIHLNLSNRLRPKVSLWSGQFCCVFWDVWMHLGCWWLSKRWWGRRWWRVWFWLHIVSNVQNTPDDQDISNIGTCTCTVERKLWSIKCPWQCSADFLLCWVEHIYVVPRLHPAAFSLFLPPASEVVPPQAQLMESCSTIFVGSVSESDRNDLIDPPDGPKLFFAR